MSDVVNDAVVEEVVRVLESLHAALIHAFDFRHAPTIPRIAPKKLSIQDLCGECTIRELLIPHPIPTKKKPLLAVLQNAADVDEKGEILRLYIRPLKVHPVFVYTGCAVR